MRARWSLPVVVLVALMCSIAAYAEGTRIAAAPTLVVDTSFVLNTLDPQRAFAPTSTIVDRAIYDTLFTYSAGARSHPVPSLVRSWKTRDYKRFVFTLKSNVRFSDGRPLTAADVVFSFRRLVNLKGNPAFLLAGVKVSSEGVHNVVLAADTPKPELLAILTNPALGIVNSKLVKAHGGTDSADASSADKAEQWLNSPASAGAGSGPYELRSYNATQEVTLRPNPRYWGAKIPPFAAVVIRNMLTADQLLNIKRGSHQIALDISSLDAGALARDKSLHLTRQPSPRVFYLFANDNPQVSDITPDNRFREAVRYALDYGALRSLAGPGARPAGGLIPSMIAGALPIQDAIKQDVARAKAALAASGIGDRPVTLEFPSDLTRSGVSYTTMAQKVQANLQAVGLNVSLSGSPVTTLLAKVHAGQVAFGLWAFIPDYLDPATFLITTPGGFIAQYVGWDKGSDPALEKLTAKALATTAAGARTSLYHRIQQQMNQRGPFIPLMQPPQVFVATSDLAGAAWSNAYSLDLTRIAPK